MPYEISVYNVNTGSFLAVATKTPKKGTQVSLYPQSTTKEMRKKWVINQVNGGSQIALNADKSLVIATKSTPENKTLLQLVEADLVTPESLFVVYSLGNAEEGSFIVSADPNAKNAFFIDNSANYTSGPAHMWSYNPGNQNWMFTDVDEIEEP